MSDRHPTQRTPHGTHLSLPTVWPTSHHVSFRSHTDRVRQEMKALGVTQLAMLRPDSLYVPKIINTDETLRGVLYGHDDRDSVMMIATDQRIIRLRRLPHYIHEEDIELDDVTGISYYGGVVSSVILHTHLQNYRVYTFNHSSALKFIGYIEERCLEVALGPSRIWKEAYHDYR